MIKRRLSALSLLVTLVAVPAAGQTTTGTGPAPDAVAQEQVAAKPAVAEAGRLERTLDLIERLAGEFGTVRDGFGVRLGGIESGAAIAAGPSWSNSSLLGGRIHLGASAAASILRDYEYDGALSVPTVVDHRLSLRISGARRHLAQERYFGAGVSSAAADETTFALDRDELRVEATAAPLPWLRFSAGVGGATWRGTDADISGVPAISAHGNAGALTELDEDINFAGFGGSATVDWRDVPLNPRHGGLYRLRFERHLDRSHDQYSFTSVDVLLEQHLSWWRRQRLVTLRALAVLTRPDQGHEVPFYLQPTIGGSHLLRGFVTDRFRDRNMMALQAEYAYDLWPFLGALAFYESGVVAPEWQELSLRNMKRDYGIGFRLGSARTVAVRTDVALGSGEGTRITMRITHAF